MFWICQITTCPLNLRSRVVIFYTSKDCSHFALLQELEWVPSQGGPLQVSNSTSVLTLLCTFIMCFVKVTIEISLIYLYFTSFHWITMVKDYIPGYIDSIWVIFEWYLMYILSLNCKILLMCCILNLRVWLFYTSKEFYTPTFPRN